jgi:hypothetical protein
MNFFSTNLLLSTLRDIVEETNEQVDPKNRALVPFKHIIAKEFAELVHSGCVEYERARTVATA